MAGDSRAYRSAEESARDLTTSIRREGGKLAERWATLRDRTDRWSVELDTTTSVRRPFCPLFLLFFTRIVWVDVPAVLTSKSQEVKSLRIRIPMASLRILWRSVCHPERLDLSGCQRDGPETAGRREFDPAVINRRKFHQEARDAARVSGVGCAESGTVSSGRKNLMTTVFICSARSRD